MDKRIMAIEPFLLEKLPQKTVLQILKQAQIRLKEIRSENQNLPKSAQFHTNGIFPRIALYQTIQEWMTKEQALEIIQDQMWGACIKTGEKISAITKHRYLRGPLLRVFALMTQKLFGASAGFQLSFIAKSDRELRFDITRCPYNDFFTRYGCPELTCVSCKADEYSYGSLPGIVFARTETLGCGGKCCDFHIYKENAK